MQRIDDRAGDCERGGAGGVEVEEESVVKVVGGRVSRVGGAGGEC
jgi:hypothetical protein